MTEQTQINQLFQDIFENEKLILAHLSGSRTKGEISKVVIRPILVKGKLCYQLTEQRQQQAFHQNLTQAECLSWLCQKTCEFKQNFIYTSDADYHILVGKKGNLTLLKKKPSKGALKLTHNRQKEYILPEGKAIPFLVRLGIMSQEGKVYAAKSDKFRQINRFLEMVEDVLPPLDLSHPLSIIDFGCGKAYLTFALYYFLKFIKGYQVDLTGIDLKEDVIHFCQDLARSLNYEDHLHFIQGDIDHYESQEEIGMVVSLHACDIATDAALEKAIRWQAKVILSAPCCQHELFSQIHQENLHSLLKHGILKERFTALVTDAARVQLLESLGYQAQILEFIDMEHTAKNLLIRAVKRPHAYEHQKKAWENYLQFKQYLHINPSLERRFKLELDQVK